MINRRKNNYLKQIFFNQKFLTLLGLVVIILISFPFAKNALKQYRIDKEISELKQEISDLENKHNILTDWLSNLDSNQSVEEVARLSFNLKKPGENVVTIIPADGDTLSDTSSRATIFNITGYDKVKPETIKSNPNKWLNYFFK